MGLRLGLAAVAAAILAANAAAAADWKVEVLVPGSAFHGVHGIRMSPRGELFAGSVAGQSLYSVNPKTGQWRQVIGPPQGMADDLAFGPDGSLYWTAISQGIVYVQRPGGQPQVLANIPSVNSIAFSRDGKRLYAAQVFGGDDLFELDPTGKTPPRRIREKMGGFNSFTVGPDGKLYGPLWFKGQVVRVDPESGEVTVIAEGLKTPAAVKMDQAGNLYALDTATGELLAIGRDGKKSRVAQLSPALDNFEIVGRLAYVTNMADNGIQEVNLRTRQVRQVIKGDLCFPVDIAIASDGGRETIYVADSFAFRAVDAKTGRTRVLDRAYTGNLQNPNGVAVGKTRVLLTGGGVVMAYDRATGTFIQSWRGLQGGADPLELPDGTILAAERGRGRVVRLGDGAPTPVAEGLLGPSSLALGRDGAVYVAEMTGGRVSRLDPASGQRTTVAEGLAAPKAIAAGGDGKLYVLEVGARQVTQIDPTSGAKTAIAGNLPVGLIQRPQPSGGGIAVGANGVVYVSSDVENAIYKLTPP